MHIISGGVTAPKGFQAAGIHCGIKDNFTTPQPEKKDLAMILSAVPCAAAGTFTRNVVKADPVILTREHLADHKAQGIIFDSGNANACAPKGMENAQRMAQAAAAATGLQPQDFAVCSTGIIGVELNIQAIEQGVPTLVASLADTPQASLDAAQAILTTDLKVKEIAVTVEIGGKTVTIGAIAKGSGMIHPNMGTMLCFLTTDCAIAAPMLKKALLATANRSFNRISVDGDTSTNDSCMILANGLAGNAPITEEGADYQAFLEALQALCVHMARSMASDGEGAKHLITCTVTGAKSEQSAETIAKSVISSTLTKAAIFGADANWGRVLCAMGYSGEVFDPDKVDVSFASVAGEIAVCAAGRGLPFDEGQAKKILTEHDVEIRVTMGEGDGSCTCWGCDITYDYIKINGDYRT